jgi:hypothetical protein
MTLCRKFDNFDFKLVSDEIHERVLRLREAFLISSDLVMEEDVRGALIE